MTSRLTFAVAGLVSLFACIGIYESQVTLMYFDKSIDVTPFTVGTFAASLLAPIVALLLGPRRGLAATTAGLALGTTVAALARQEQVELAAATVGCVSGMWWLAIVAGLDLGEDVIELAVAVPITLAVLIIGRSVARTMPLDEIALPFAVPILIVLVAGLVWPLRSLVARARGWVATDPRGIVSLFAVPFVFALAADVALNGAVVGGAAGLALGPGREPSTFIGLLAGAVGIAVALVALATRTGGAVLACAALVAGAAALWTRLGVLPLVGGATLAFGLALAGIRLAGTTRRSASSPLARSLALGAGWIASGIATLAYYLSVGSLVPLIVGVAVVTGATAVAAPRSQAPLRWRVPAMLAALVVLAPLVAIATAPAAVASHASDLRVMTYNIHLGYDDGDVAAVPAIADVIAAQSPDVVGLEEVTRGTVIAGGHDVLELLADDLGMSYVFAPMLGDVEGVAILSRRPIDAVRTVPLARSTKTRDLNRVALMVHTGGIWFVVTHLGGDDFTTQVASLIEAVRGLDTVIVSGDMNSLPDSPQMRLFAAAGFSDLGAAAAHATIPVDAPIDRIDYLWALGVRASEVRTINVSASDHLPVVADLVGR